VIEAQAGRLSRLLRLSLTFVVVLAFSQGIPLAEQTSKRRLADRIVAIANDQVVTEHQLEQALSADREYLTLLEQTPRIERTEKLKKRKRGMLDLLIDRRLMVSEGMRIGVAPDESLIQKRIDRTMERFGIETVEAFEQVLAREGFTLALLKALYADEYVEQAVLDARVRATIDISEAQILAYAEENESDLASPERVNFAQMLFRVTDFDDEAGAAAAKARAERMLERLQLGEPFDKVCESADNALKSCDGLGFLGKDEMFPSLSKVALGLSIGQASGVIRSPMGFHIIRLLERQGGDAEMTPELKRKIKETLYMREFEKRYDAFIKELRARSYMKIMLNAP